MKSTRQKNRPPVFLLSYTSRAKAEAAAKALAKGMTASYGTQIIVTDNVLKIIYE